MRRRAVDERNSRLWVSWQPKKSPEAIRLYEPAGYRRIEKYGFYQHNPQSIGFEKRLT
jgi:hypothetical protein